jgi:hypothetical protein
MDFGPSVYWISRYKGYFYANGEIIKYDAAEFSVTIGLWYDISADKNIDYTKQYFVEPGSLAPASVVADTNARVKSGELTEIQASKLLDQWKATHKQGSSNVWISSNEEYQKYLSVLPFNGKIYPTGRIRIYTVPYYETVDGVTKIKNGVVVEHGRAQFGTTIATHTAGISPYWSNNANVRGCNMNSDYLLTTNPNPTVPTTVVTLSFASAAAILSASDDFADFKAAAITSKSACEKPRGCVHCFFVFVS